MFNAAFFLTFFAVFAGGVVFQRLGMKQAVKSGLISYPGFRHWHEKPTALTGGVAVVSSMILGLLLFFVWVPQGQEILSWWPVVLGALIVFCGGLWDDLFGLAPAKKLLLQVAGAGMALGAPEIQELIQRWEVLIGFWVWPLVVFWIVGITNAINVIDGLDGLAGTVGFLILGTVVGIGLAGFGSVSAAALSLLVLGALAAFLVFNWTPAKVFLGDNGSLTLGFFIATMALTLNPGASAWTEPLAIILLAGYPVLDLGWITVIRLRHGKSPLCADRSHIHYSLKNLGLTSSQVVGLLGSFHATFVVASCLLRWSTGAQAGFVLTAELFLVAVFLTVLMLYARRPSLQEAQVIPFAPAPSSHPPPSLLAIEVNGPRDKLEGFLAQLEDSIRRQMSYQPEWVGRLEHGVLGVQYTSTPHTNPEKVRKELAQLVTDCEANSGHLFNVTVHFNLPETNSESLAAS